MGHNTPRKRSDGKIDYNNIYNTEQNFAGAPDPRQRDMGPDPQSSGHDRGEHSVINPFDVNEAGQVLDAPKQMKEAAGVRGNPSY